MAETSRGITLLDGASVVNPIQTPFNQMANDVTDALDDLEAGLNVGYLIGTNAERLALTAPQLRNGVTWFATDTNIVWERRGSEWFIKSRPYAAYSPTVSGLTASQVTVTAAYEQTGTWVKGRVRIQRTTAGSPTGTIAISLPLAPVDTTSARSLGDGSFYLANNSTAYIAIARYTGGSNFTVSIPQVAGTALSHGSNVNGTYPTSAAHAVGTNIYVTFEYEVA